MCKYSPDSVLTVYRMFKSTHSLWFCVLGEAKGLRSAAMRTSCLLPPPVLTPRTPASGVFRPLEPGVRPGVAPALGVRLGVAPARPGVRLGVWEVDAPASSPSHILPGVCTKHSSRVNSLVLCILCAREKREMMRRKQNKLQMMHLYHKLNKKQFKWHQHIAPSTW